MPENPKPSLGVSWLRAELESLVRDFSLSTVLAQLSEITAPDTADHTKDILQAFTALDHESGNHNHVSLVHLRGTVRMARTHFDSALFRLVISHRMNLVPCQATYRMSTEEIEASFKHGVERYIFVSVVILPAPRRRPETLHDTKEKPLTQQELTELALSRKDSP